MLTLEKYLKYIKQLNTERERFKPTLRVFEDNSLMQFSWKNYHDAHDAQTTLI
jgi:hypothetical protein